MDLEVKIGKTVFKNPIWVASGTFGHGEEFEDFLDLGSVGAIVAKTITLEERAGNSVPRICETASGLLNSIGLENKGIKRFKAEDMPFMKKLGTKTVISIAGDDPDGFAVLAGELSGDDEPDAIELNLSCPNVSHEGSVNRLFAQDPGDTEKITAAVKKRTGAPVIVKLTPNVTDIAKIAESAKRGGADAVSLVNTYFGMAVDAQAMRPALGNITGGLSGPAIKPMALKAVWDVYQKVDIPIIGIGGIMTGMDAAEFMLCGASCVQVGTANLVDPSCYARILEEFKQYLKKKDIKKLNELKGALKTKP